MTAVISSKLFVGLMTIVNAFLLQNTSSLVVRIIKSDAHAFKILFISKPIPI